MTNAFLQTALLRAKSRKNKKQNGFTLIELMVVVAIVGILSGVGLPQLLKAQDKAKDSVTLATLTNAAKECSLLLVTEGSGDNFDNGEDGSNYTVGKGDELQELGGTGCSKGGTLTLASLSEGNPVATVEFDPGGIPKPAAFPDEAGGTTTPPAGGTNPPAGGTV